ncbi:MAG: eukaryotic-like serine/threonine-protein kinase [Acidobacteriota bacterium]|nr:eukaryotic-like serine/threonine-protein kinase [Acidobacteriota bacterium]
MQVLVCLARHAPEVVSKQRLMREVWGDETFVTDEVMTHAIWELRKAFGDEAKSPRYIQTLSRKGYRLLAEVSRCAAPEPLAAGSRIGQYEILEPVAGGAMGEVYKARDERLGRVVALKFLPADLSRDSSARKRFQREAQAVAQLDHPNVATIYDIGETEGGRMFLALAFYEGETLQQKLESGPLPLTEAVGIARQVAKGLAAAHQRKVVHRDIKPANMVVLPDGTLKILDFGLAKMSGATLLTRLGSSPGTPAYKSPEQTRGEEADPRSDLWALGVVLYEMVAGRVPFGGDYEQAVIYSILNEPMRPLDDSVSEDLTAVIQKALEKDADARYQTAEEMEADLGAVSMGRDVVRSKPASGRQERRKPDVLVMTIRKKRLYIVLSSLAVLGLAVGLWYLWYWGEQQREYQREHLWDFSPEVKQFVDQGDRLEWRGDTERILGDAEQVYRIALEREPVNPVIKAYLAALLTRIQLQFPTEERLKEIRLLTEQSVTGAPDHPMPWVAKAKLLLWENKPVEAEQAALQAIKRDLEFDRGYTVRGEALIRQGKKKEGLEEIKRGTEVGEGYLRAQLEYGIQLRSVGDYEEAAIELGKVLDLDPSHPTALHNLGEVHLQTGREPDALPLLRKAAELGEWRSANSLGNLYLKMGGRDHEALKYFTDAYKVKRDPTVARNLAETYEKLGEADEAPRWYETALKGFDEQLAQGGSRADLLNVRSFCAAKLGRFDEAFSNIHEAMKLKPNENSFLKRAAQVYLLAGHREEAFSYVRQAVQAGLSRDEIRNDFVFQRYLNDPEFRAILEGS